MIEGARRIGKSYIVEEFAKNEYTSYILIDFNQVSNRVKKWFDDYIEDLDTFFELLEQHYHVKLVPRQSVIIFDEVQLCPRARAAIKYLVADTIIWRQVRSSASSAMSRILLYPQRNALLRCILWILKSSFGQWGTKR